MIAAVNRISLPSGEIEIQFQNLLLRLRVKTVKQNLFVRHNARLIN